MKKAITLLGLLLALPVHAAPLISGGADVPFYQSSYFWSIIAVAAVLIVAAILVGRERHQ